MVQEMRKAGWTLAKIAVECGKSISWVYSRLDVRYAPVGSQSEEKVEAPVKESEDGAGEETLEEIDEQLKEIEEEERRLVQQLGHSPNRTYEELVEYRKQRDAEVKNPD